MIRPLATIAVVCLLCGPLTAQDVSPIVSEGLVDAPLAQVWAAFTTGEGLRSWMAPHAEIDLRVGGRMLATTTPRDRSMIRRPSRTR